MVGITIYLGLGPANFGTAGSGVRTNLPFLPQNVALKLLNPMTAALKMAFASVTVVHQLTAPEVYKTIAGRLERGEGGRRRERVGLADTSLAQDRFRSGAVFFFLKMKAARMTMAPRLL